MSEHDDMPNIGGVLVEEFLGTMKLFFRRNDR
jgi:hypothetical protein